MGFHSELIFGQLTDNNNIYDQMQIPYTVSCLIFQSSVGFMFSALFFLSIVRCQLPHNLLDNVRIRPRVLSSYKNDKMSTLSPVRWRWWYDNTHPLIYVHNAHGSNCVDGSIHICLCYTHVPHISHHICTFMINVYILRWSLGTTSAISFRCLYNYRICAAVGYSTYTQYLLLY